MNTLLEVAKEVDALIYDLKIGWNHLTSAEQVSFFCACMMLACCMMPWITLQGENTELGLNNCGIFHVALSIFCIRSHTRAAHQRQLYGADIHARRRLCLWNLILGGGATLICVVILIYYSSVGAQSGHAIQVRYGFHLTIIAGFGVSFGGLLGFYKTSSPCSIEPGV